MFTGKLDELKQFFALCLFLGNSNLSTCNDRGLRQQCTDGVPARPPNSVAGFYYKDDWHSLVCNNRHFRAHCKVPKSLTMLTRVRDCLRNHSLHFWGDSTLRQWYEYFADVMNGTLEEHKAENVKFGPHEAVDKTNDIRFSYRHHGFPIRNGCTLVKDIHYVPNMIDEIKSGGNDIILLTLWAHFIPNDLEYYRQRWKAIRDAIVRLRSRNPDARVIIKSANTREPHLDCNSLYFHCSNWYAGELDRVMREMMTGVEPVTIIDTWDMTIGHRTGFRIHPKREIISQEVDMLLSFLCPSLGFG